jgi:Family of unknown function (DUF6512)
VNKKRIFTWEMAGFVIISITGNFLHFVFNLLGKWPPAALITAVNESTWEHLKLAFWPALFYALIEWPFFRRQVKDFWTAKAIGLLAMPLVIVSVFYGYTALAGRHFLWADISLFVLAVLIGQLLSGRLLLRQSFNSGSPIPGRVLLVLMIAAFSLLTYFPPHHPLFRDPQTGQFGILK